MPVVSEEDGVHCFLNPEDVGSRIQAAHKTGVEICPSGEVVAGLDLFSFARLDEAKPEVWAGFLNFGDDALEGDETRFAGIKGGATVGRFSPVSVDNGGLNFIEDTV